MIPIPNSTIESILKETSCETFNFGSNTSDFRGCITKSTAPKSSEHTIGDQTAINKDSVAQDKRTNTMNKDKELIKSIDDNNNPTFTSIHCPTPKYNLSPTHTEPLVYPLHRPHTESIHIQKNN